MCAGREWIECLQPKYLAHTDKNAGIKCWCFHWHRLKNSFLWTPIKSFYSVAFPQQFAYGINSTKFFSSTYSTQCGELLITFRNGNSAQNLSVGNQYGIQKITNFWLINMLVLSVGASIDIVWKIAFFGHPSSLFILLRFRNSLLTGLTAQSFLVVHIPHNAESY